jgi:hypothetical protein
LCGGVLVYVAQEIPPIEAEIAGKDHLWTETILASRNDCAFVANIHKALTTLLYFVQRITPLKTT